MWNFSEFSFVGRLVNVVIPNILTWLAIMNRLSNKGNQDSWGYGDLNFCQKLKHVTLKAGMNNILYDYGIFLLKGSRSFFLSLTGCSKDFLFGRRSCSTNIFIKITLYIYIYIYVYICFLFILYIHIYIHTLFYLINYIYTHTQPKKKSLVFLNKIVFDGNLL